MHPRGRGPAGIGRTAVDHRWRVPARLVAHRFYARLRWGGHLDRDLRWQVPGRRRTTAAHARDTEDPAHPPEHGGPFRLPQIGDEADAEVLPEEGEMVHHVRAGAPDLPCHAH